VGFMFVPHTNVLLGNNKVLFRAHC